MNITETLKQKITHPCRVVFPEAQEPAILEAAYKAYREGICHPVFVGDAPTISNTLTELGITDSFYSIIPADDESVIEQFADRYYETNQIFSVKRLKRLMKQPLYIGAIALSLGEVDAMVCGLTYATAEVILASTSIVGLKENVSVPSSFFLMNIPNFEGPEGTLIILSDGGACENPDESELADIAITTAYSARRLLSWEPRVAMLSYSTNGSSVSEMTEKVVNAKNIAKEKKES